MLDKKYSAKEKALQINLNDKLYGSFAEIGAGQEVAANFFKAGGASGTIAKTMSAYDMAFSDAIYGPEESGRYVCESRLHKMLDKEYRLCIRRLNFRADKTCFFAFANTVEAINFKRTNEGHGWIGLKFQLAPEAEPNECTIHVRLLDNDPLLQQQALGIIGVNLIYGCYFLYQNPEQLLNSLLDEVTRLRAEVDYFRLSGPDFRDVDHRLFSLKLVKNGLTNATIFGPDGTVMQPADMLYKKNLLVLRGRFRPVTHVHLDMLKNGFEHFMEEEDVDPAKLMTFAELTLNDLRNPSGEIDETDFVDRADLLCSLGLNVIISNYSEYYKLIPYLSKFTRKRKIGMIVGVYNIESIFNESYYTQLKGGILEAFGELFGNNLKLYIYPSFEKGSQQLIKSTHLRFPEHLKPLYDYLILNKKLEDLVDFNEENLHIISDDALQFIKEGNGKWEQMVPKSVVGIIKEKRLFGYGTKS